MYFANAVHAGAHIISDQFRSIDRPDTADGQIGETGMTGHLAVSGSIDGNHKLRALHLVDIYVAGSIDLDLERFRNIRSINVYIPRAIDGDHKIVGNDASVHLYITGAVEFYPTQDRSTDNDLGIARIPKSDALDTEIQASARYVSLEILFKIVRDCHLH